MRNMKKKAFLVLEDGTVFKGYRFGAEIDSIGELVFTTGMCGYCETLTDPSYYGQIVLQTFPLIGNYGIIPDDFEGDTCARGYVVREACDHPSNFRSEMNLDSYLKKCGVPGIYGVDTRQITRIIREHGVMNAIICNSVPDDLSNVKKYKISNAVSSTTCHDSYDLVCSNPKYNVILIDYGAKRNIGRELVKRNCKVTVVPSTVTADEIMSMAPDGLMLSNGPGDPQDNKSCIEQLKRILGQIPMFGICLGHQLIALAAGGKTYKLKYGHRGVNQPVRDVLGTRTFITSQNHGYAVDSRSLVGIGQEIYQNANDRTCEGMEYPQMNCFSVQFHPEACSGPKDTEFLFDRFIYMMEASKNAKR